MLANPQASATNTARLLENSCAPFDFLKNVGLPNKYEGEDRWLTTSAVNFA